MVRSFLAFAFLFLVFALPPAFAEEAKKTFKDAEYLALVDAAVTAPEKADWAGLRTLYLESSFYDKVVREGIGGMMFSDLGKKAAETKKPEDIAAYKAHARNYAGSVDTHMEALNLVKKQKADFVNEAFGKAALKGLAEALLKTGDGKTLKTAIKAASTSEQYFIMRSYYGLQPRRQSLEHHQGQSYDVHRVSDSKGEDVGEIFFNISLYFGRTEFPAEAQAQFDKINESMRAEAKKRPPPVVAPEDQKYLDAVDAARKDPAAAKWSELRELYANSSYYKRVGGINLGHQARDMTGYVLARLSPEAIERYKQYHREHYAGAGTQASAQRIAEKTKADFVDAATAKAALDGITKSVLASGDGKTADTAYKTISVDEASTVLPALFPDKPDMKVEDKGEQKIMVFTGKTKDGKDMSAYFALDVRANPPPPKQPAPAPKP